MLQRRPFIVSFILAACVTVCGFAAPPQSQDAAWPPVTATTRPWTYWWWMGSAVDPENLAREFRRYHDAGLGGVHVIPIYGAKGYEVRYVEYLSPKWMELLRFTLAEARRLDMGVDMTTGTGWCFGGPNMSRATPRRPRVRARLSTWRPANKLASGSTGTRAGPGGL